MRQMISGLVAAVAVMARRCARDGVRLRLVLPCARPMSRRCVTSTRANYRPCCGGWVHERLPDPEQQYYYVNQGPTYTGPGNFAPYPIYQEELRSYGYRPARQLLSRPRAALPYRGAALCCAATTDRRDPVEDFSARSHHASGR